jgi:tRNA modification GTPase
MINVFNKIDEQHDTVYKNTASKYYISCKNKFGLDGLKQGCLEQFFDQSAIEPSEMLSNLRQIAELKAANILIEKCLNNLNQNHTLDIISIDLNEAISSLSNIVGDDFTEELLDGIFANFCIGK